MCPGFGPALACREQRTPALVTPSRKDQLEPRIGIEAGVKKSPLASSSGHRWASNAGQSLPPKPHGVSILVGTSASPLKENKWLPTPIRTHLNPGARSPDPWSQFPGYCF